MGKSREKNTNDAKGCPVTPQCLVVNAGQSGEWGKHGATGYRGAKAQTHYGTISNTHPLMVSLDTLPLLAISPGFSLSLQFLEIRAVTSE